MRWIPFLFLALAVTAHADDWPQWRGANRDGHSAETGLLQRWPDDGPKQAWSVQGLGRGYASVSIAKGRIYTTGMRGSDGWLFCYSTQGKLLWKKNYGAEWSNRGGYPGSRCTPTVHDGRVYVFSGQGRMGCYDAKSGKRLWYMDTKRAFRGRNIQWGYSQSPLISGSAVICQPGGNNASIVALNRKTGRTIWTSRGWSEKSAYCSAALIKHGRNKLIVTTTASHVVGLNLRGQVMWKVPMQNTYSVHANTPVYKNGLIYIGCGYGWGSMALKLNGSGNSVSQLWKKRLLDTHHGGVVLIGNYIYGTSSNKPRNQWLCIDIRNGQEKHRARGVGKGSVITADGMLYCYGEKGSLALVKATPEGHRIISQFRIEMGDRQHWAHPAISDGVLYIRHGDALMAFSIKK
ncbi:PQQ-like beta-propeller repeat protein [bacterium AH-315-M10]|nr:PQQ-like beta-propeller repeat protein [bacterium AH-315-M10]